MNSSNKDSRLSFYKYSTFLPPQPRAPRRRNLRRKIRNRSFQFIVWCDWLTAEFTRSSKLSISVRELIDQFKLISRPAYRTRINRCTNESPLPVTDIRLDDESCDRPIESPTAGPAFVAHRRHLTVDCSRVRPADQTVAAAAAASFATERFALASCFPHFARHALEDERWTMRSTALCLDVFCSRNVV